MWVSSAEMETFLPRWLNCSKKRATAVRRSPSWWRSIAGCPWQGSPPPLPLHLSPLPLHLSPQPRLWRLEIPTQVEPGQYLKWWKVGFLSSFVLIYDLFLIYIIISDSNACRAHPPSASASTLALGDSNSGWAWPEMIKNDEELTSFQFCSYL